jgi:enterochelin esterase-like enzyme
MPRVSTSLDVPLRQPWLSTLGDWRWPGTAPAAEVLLPPAWIPATPPAAPLDTAAPARRRRTRRRRALRTASATTLAGVAAASLALATHGTLSPGALLGASRPAVAPAQQLAAPVEVRSPLPQLVQVGHDAAGSVIARAKYPSPSLDAQGGFYVYLPPGFPIPGHRYPVLYMLHGQIGHATAFLEVGTQPTLDKLIGAGKIPPMIAVMIQDAPTLYNWINSGRRQSANYVIEVQELVDRMLPTIPERSGRAIVGSSMGGHGAMRAALSNPDRYAVAESWLSYFNNLEGLLGNAKPTIERYGLSAFLYGAEGDTAADPSQDAPFAASLRAAGADAQSAVFPGNHSLTTVREHLEEMLLFAGQSLVKAQQRVAREVRAVDSVLQGS